MERAELYDDGKFLTQIDPKYKVEFRTEVAYENAHRMSIMFYFFLVFFLLFIVLDIIRFKEGLLHGNLLYSLLAGSHVLFFYQIITSAFTLRNRDKLKRREFPNVIRLERRFMLSMLIGLLPMGILGIFERETLIVLAIYSVMINIVMQLGHRRCIEYNVISFILALFGILVYFGYIHTGESADKPYTFILETVGVFAIPFFISRRQYNAKLREFEYQKILAEQNEIIRIEKDKADELLLNILPKEVAEELKDKGYSEAHQFENVTVLFTDFVNFTRLSEHLTPKELVAEIHFCFKEFDSITEKYGLEKIKTIGDAYLAVSGLPTSDSRHAYRVVAAALEMRDFIERHKREKIREHKDFLDIRIGIHSGPVVAGIVGVKKFAYDIWGDTVNTAARMEQSSIPGKITISETTHKLVEDAFVFVDRGHIEAKNKGEIHMYFVEAFKGERIVELLNS
ncbi:MAG: adenylate/guanylate cyclase domain-containing protein [Flavobacteriales bacterium]|nr:adenylate/guanylate cyclase domain-containing protein [Flavobacteriales bacterium]